MDKSYLLKDKEELGVENYSENYEVKECNCSCKKKGISILRKASSDEETKHI